MNRENVRAPETVVRLLLMVSAVMVVLLTLDQLRLFGRPLLDDIVVLETHFYYALLGLLLPFAFLIYRSNHWVDLYWLDVLLAVLALGCCAWLFQHAEPILDEGWEFIAPDRAIQVSLVLWLLVLEAIRRAGGLALFSLVTLFSVYPLFADKMPEMLSGMSIGIKETAAYHVMSIESMLGLPFRAFANLVIGFLIFGVALQHTGGGRFFIDLAYALFGRVRGGPAKVAIVSSGLMGSMSGSVITNVVTTGQLTIPVMKENGIRAQTAAAVEACASTGGVLLPPIMGSTAFVMATFLEMPYYSVALAAAIPAVLYFLTLFIQLDAYAGREALQGLPAEALPSVRHTLRTGWYYLASFILLTVLLLVLQREQLAPWAATACLLLVHQIFGEGFNRTSFSELLVATARLLVELLVILTGVGLIVGALSVTGLSGTLINDLLFLAGGSTGALLIMGALTSFILGIGMTVTAAYIFLAIVLAPALIEGGLNPLAVHLFILYWGMLSFITPPVALGAFAAAAIARARPMLAAFDAMRLSAVIYLIPFLFVIEPALILASGFMAAFWQLLEVVPAIFFIAAGIQGWLPVLGRLSGHSALSIMTGGLLVALPDMSVVGISVAEIWFTLPGLLLLAVGLVAGWLRRPVDTRSV